MLTFSLNRVKVHEKPREVAVHLTSDPLIIVNLEIRNAAKLREENYPDYGLRCVTELRDASRCLIRGRELWQFSTHFPRRFSIHYFMFPLNDYFSLFKVTNFYLL